MSPMSERAAALVRLCPAHSTFETGCLDCAFRKTAAVEMILDAVKSATEALIEACER